MNFVFAVCSEQPEIKTEHNPIFTFEICNSDDQISFIQNYAAMKLWKDIQIPGAGQQNTFHQRNYCGGHMMKSRKLDNETQNCWFQAQQGPGLSL